MRGWTSATVDGQCSFDKAHKWKAGARVFRVQGATWLKEFCPACAAERHGAPDDTGQVLDTTDAPSYPTPLKQMAEIAAAAIADRFDAKAAAAGKDAD